MSVYETLPGPDAPPGVKQTVSGRYVVDGMYYVRKALEALGLWGTLPVASTVQAQSFVNMQRDNTIGNDKYFHCVANCQSSRAAGTMAACAVANAREDFQDLIKRHNEDRQADEAANALGRNSAAGGGTCQQQCSQYIVTGINPRCLPGGQ